MATVQLSQKESDVDYRIETIAKLLAHKDGVDMKMHRQIAKEWFMSVHADYYLEYVARRRKDVSMIVVSPHYVVIELKGRNSTINDKYYVVGVDYDADALFVNRVNYVDMYNFYAVNIEHVNDVSIIYTHDDAVKKNIFHYDYDVTDPRFTIDKEGRFRVQGDLVFDVTTLDLLNHAQAWALHEVYRYVRYLTLDRIAAILNDHGISYNVDFSRAYRHENTQALIIHGGSDSSRWSKYSARNRARIVELLSKYFDVRIKEFSFYTICDVKLTVDKITTFARVEIISLSSFGSHVGDIEIVVREAGDLKVVELFARDIAEQFHALPKTNVVRQIGNHRVELYHVVPVRFAYEPFIKPLVLEPQTLYIAPRDTYVVDNDSFVELHHKEHGRRDILIDGKYVLRIDRVLVHPRDTAERNRVVLSKIEPYKEQ